MSKQALGNGERSKGSDRCNREGSKDVLRGFRIGPGQFDGGFDLSEESNGGQERFVDIDRVEVGIRYF